MRYSPIGLLAVAFMTSVAAACWPTPSFSVVLPVNPEFPLSAPALPVLVVDHAGVIVGVEPGEARRGRSLAVRRHPTNPTALIVEWPGGACERQAVLEFWRAPDGYRLTLREDLNKPCEPSPAGRELRLILNQPLDPADVTFEPEGGLMNSLSPRLFPLTVPS